MYQRPTFYTLALVVTLALLSTCLSLALQLTNYYFLGYCLSVQVVAILGALALSLGLSILASRSHNAHPAFIIGGTVLVTSLLTLSISLQLHYRLTGIDGWTLLYHGKWRLWTSLGS